MKIVNAFSEDGYEIDIIDCLDVKALGIVQNKRYDLIFGFGETFYQLTSKQKEAVSILYMTESHPEFSYMEERKRLDYFYERHGRRLKMNRSGKYYKLNHLQKKYDYLVTMSDNKWFGHQYSNPYFIFPTGLINPGFEFRKMDHSVSRKQFIWLGSTGAVHKGLDLLLDVFKNHDDILLHVCGLHKDERAKLRIPRRKSIIEHGHINIFSDKFLNLVDLCSFIILPSCSEGFSTAITTGMLHGLIPVVMKDTGFNKLGEAGVFLEDYRIDYLDIKLTELSHYDPERLTALSKKAYDFAVTNFTLPVFSERFKSILKEIVTKEKN
ncbi:MAG: glycosyltransferase family 4 protein [Bacteroidales bacterium]|nr:glycosyltransferase family 4 protein [Bacteroidales bacterium]